MDTYLLCLMKLFLPLFMAVACNAMIWENLYDSFGPENADKILQSLRTVSKWCVSSNNDTKRLQKTGWARDLDLCCQEADKCEDFIPPDSWQYAVYNSDQYKRLLCSCEDRFARCLKNITGSSAIPARIVVISYFVFMRSWCFEKLYDASCNSRWFYDSEGYAHLTNEDNKYFCPKFFRNIQWDTLP